MRKWPSKDPQEVLDFEIDWTARMTSGDTISSSSFAVPSGLTLTLQQISGNVTIAWLSGGTSGVIYNITNTIITSQGRTMEETVSLPVRNR